MFSVCVFLDLWMLCLYVEMRFESLICGLDVCLSSLFVAFISMFFSLLEKPSFFKLDSFSTHPRQIPFYRAFFFRSRQILNPSKFLGFISIESWQLLRSIELNFFTLYLLDRFSTNCLIHRGDFCYQQILNSTLTNSLLSRFSAQQILNRNLDPSSCIFYI